MDNSELSSRFTQLCDGRPGLRTTLQVEISQPAGPLSPSHGERAGERGHDTSTENHAASPLPSDGRGIKGEGHSPSDSQPVLDFISSDETLDRYDEIITASGWKLDSYRRNPVFQNAHQYGDIIFTLGKALITEVRTRQPSTNGSGAQRRPDRSGNSQPSTYLFQRIQFATDVNPMARIAYGLYRGKFLNAVSVGFVPIRWENPVGSLSCSLSPPRGERAGERGRHDTSNSTASPLPSDGRGIKGEGSLHSTLNSQPSTKQFRRKYLEQELLEVSAVAIPANPNALALGLKSGAVEKSDLRDLSDLLRATLGGSSSHPPTDSPIHSLDLLRRLHTILRS